MCVYNTKILKTRRNVTKRQYREDNYMYYISLIYNYD